MPCVRKGVRPGYLEAAQIVATSTQRRLYLERSRGMQQQWLKQAYQFWQVAEQLYARIKEHQPTLTFTVSSLFPFLLHWLQLQSFPPRLFWSPALSTTPTQPFSAAV